MGKSKRKGILMHAAVFVAVLCAALCIRTIRVEAGYETVGYNGNNAGPSGISFKAVIQYIVTDHNTTGCRITKRCYVWVTDGSESGSTVTSNMKASWTGANTKITTAGTYAITDVDLGWLTRGSYVSHTEKCYYTGGSGTTYTSTVTSSYTVPTLTWSEVPTVSPNPYYKITDMATYGANVSSAGNSFDSMFSHMDSRMTYFKKISVKYGDVLCLTGTAGDTGSGGTVTSDDRKLYYNVMEYNSSGNCIWDSGWINTDSSWSVGTDTRGSAANSGLSRSSAAYVILEFRVYTGDASIGSGTAGISASTINSAFGNLYISKRFTYTADCNGGGINGSSALTYYRDGTAAALSGAGTKLSDPVRTGFRFDGWKVTSNNAMSPNWMNGNTYSTASLNSYISRGNFYNSLFGNITLTAQWTALDYSLTLIGNGGIVPESPVTVTYGTDSNSSLAIPSREGYLFLGYYTSPAGGDCIYGPDGKTTNDGTYWIDGKCAYMGDYTLYAHWEMSYHTVAYDANGGSYVSVDSAVVGYGGQVDLNPTAHKDGHIFIGWNTDPAAKEGLTSLTMPASDIILYAIYSIPVSDVKELYIQSWVPGRPENYRICQLSRTNERGMYYTYELEDTNIAQDFGVPVAASLFAWDHAGNYRIIKTWYPDPAVPEEPEVPEWFLQTVNHYRYDNIARDWILFETVSEEAMKGETYTPQYITPPDGYKEDHIDGAYVVEADTVKAAYYLPVSYILTFDPNGGTCAIKNKIITYGDVYGNLPTAERIGHTFLGWFPDPDGGTRITAGDKYELTEDSTVYAHWKIREYTVYYDYRTNGGTSADKEYEVLSYGMAIDLNTGALKPGWEHIGWNTDPDAEEGLDSCIIEEKDVTLYAIYRKVITVTYIDSNGSDAAGEPVTTVRKEAVTIYNKAAKADFTVPELNELAGWQKEGWSFSREADSAVDASAGTDFSASEDVTFYGRYSREVTVSYDTSGAATEIPEETKVRQYNASGESLDTVFTLADAPELGGHSFVSWEDEKDREYEAGQSVVCKEDTLFTAIWDKYPEIEAYDRYFTLEQAKNGEITVTVLLEKVKGTDREDGTLTNGTDVIVINHQPEDFTGFTAGGSVTVTYQATDSFGNVTTKTVTVHIVDTSLKEDKTKQYVRFISRQFYRDGEDYVPAELGGLEALSVWRTNAVYKAALEDALSNEKTNETLINVGLFGKDYKVIQPGTGSWDHSMETWEFTKAQIDEVKEYVNVKGYGNYKTKDGLEGFLERFGTDGSRSD